MHKKEYNNFIQGLFTEETTITYKVQEEIGWIYTKNPFFLMNKLNFDVEEASHSDTVILPKF